MSTDPSLCTLIDHASSHSQHRRDERSPIVHEPLIERDRVVPRVDRERVRHEQRLIPRSRIGLARPQAAEFSFLLGIPTLLAAAAKESLDAIKDPPPYPIDWSMVLLGAVVSAITAFIAVKWLLRFVQSNTFNVFGIYRIILGSVILLALWS